MEKISWDAIEFNFVVDIFIKLIIQLFARVCINSGILNWKILDTTNVLYRICSSMVLFQLSMILGKKSLHEN